MNSTKLELRQYAVNYLSIHYTHKKRIQELFKQRFSLEEIHIMYNNLIPYRQLRSIVSRVKRDEAV